LIAWRYFLDFLTERKKIESMKITHSYSDITDWFFEILTSLLEKQENVTVGLGGGSSFDEFYRYVLLDWRLKIEDWRLQKIRWCVTDERVNCDISDRNDEHIWEIFLGPLFEQYGIPEENFIRSPLNPPIQSWLSSPLSQVTRLWGESIARTRWGGNVTDSFTFYFSPSTSFIDIAFFGMGPDGHTASLFPHHPALESEEEWFIKIDNAPKLPPERISLSPKSIQSLKYVCLFAVWESKKEALANFLDDTVDVRDCPVKLLKPEIILDLTR
jgi:6-phosphogluconolactonase